MLRGGHLRALRRSVQAPVRALPGHARRVQECAAQLGRGGGGERDQDRPSGDWSPCRDRLRSAFHGRTLLTMALTSKVIPYKRGFGPFASEVYRAPAPYEFRGVDSDAAIRGLLELFKADVDPQTVACVVLEPVQGEGGFIRCRPTSRAGCRRSAPSTGSSTCTMRSSRALAARGRCGPSSTTTSSPTCWSRANRSGAGCRSPR